ncbi:hypothetical protein [Burkholderia oklahomensis]|nr:hypothetical protein [Burkholderia oklahomensis]QPS36970.1 hypothetical protein I6G57_17035 [Burkholderia oklahomensis]
MLRTDGDTVKAAAVRAGGFLPSLTEIGPDGGERAVWRVSKRLAAVGVAWHHERAARHVSSVAHRWRLAVCRASCASRKPQAASRKPQAASRKPQVASRSPQADRRKPIAENGKPKTASAKTKATHPKRWRSRPQEIEGQASGSNRQSRIPPTEIRRFRISAAARRGARPSAGSFVGARSRRQRALRRREAIRTMPPLAITHRLT